MSRLGVPTDGSRSAGEFRRKLLLTRLDEEDLPKLLPKVVAHLMPVTSNTDDAASIGRQAPSQYAGPA